MSAPEDEAAHATALLEACPALYQRAYATTRRDYRERFDSGGGGPLPLFPPMMVEMEQQPSRKRALPPSCKTPFLCTAAGCLPRGVPGDADSLLSRTGVLLPLSQDVRRVEGGPGSLPS